MVNIERMSDKTFHLCGETKLGHREAKFKVGLKAGSPSLGGE